MKKITDRLAGRDIEVIEGLDTGPGTHDYLSTLPYWVGRSPIINMPTSLLVMQGAFRFDEGHPFVRAITGGRRELEDFYQHFQPANLAGMYRLPEGLPGGDLPPWELPWLLRDRRAPVGEKGLGPEHGVSFYGPCSGSKIDLEMKRLTRLAGSITSRGYRRSPARHVSGHFLQSGSEVRFFVRGGKHRAAALAALGFDRIPVRMRDTWPRVVCRAQVANWPLVRSGAVDSSFACEVFDRYFE